MQANLQDRSKRAKLKARPKPYWKQIYKGVALGYRRNKKGGVWLLRRFEGGRYLERPLGPADDFGDGAGLSFEAAQKAALSNGDIAEYLGLKATQKAKEYTVGQALDAYLEDYDARSGKDTSLKHRIDKHVRPKLGRIEVAKLTTARITNWRNALVRKDTEDLELLRRSRYNANKSLTCLKSALNFVYRQGIVKNVDAGAWREVEPFKKVDVPKIRYLDTKESKRLINACDPEFRPLVQCALLTGCRYGEILSMRVADVRLKSSTVHLPYTKSGSSRNVYLTEEGVRFFGQHIAGKTRGDLVFTRMDGSRWGKNHQVRRIREACERAKIDPPISFHILRHTYGASLAHKGVSLQVIAKALGHADTRITEKHYAHIADQHIKDQLNAKLPKLGIKPGKVRAL